MSLIKIIPLQFAGIEELERMLPVIGARFKSEAVLGLHYLDMTHFFDPVRAQYNANEIIRELIPLSQKHETVVGVTDIDLFIPVLSYIFGQAYLGGSTALVSGYRLQNSRYGLADDPKLFYSRLLKSILHELGHTYGLRHCLQPGCIMLSSTYVEEIDQKSDVFCKQCRSELRQFRI